SRRFLSPEDAAAIGALDREAIERVRAEARPQAESADELHDALMLFGCLSAAEGSEAGFGPLLEALSAQSRATVVRAGELELWVAAERLSQVQALHPEATLEPAIAAPPRLRDRTLTREEAAVEMLRGRLELAGPTTTGELAITLGLGGSE